MTKSKIIRELARDAYELRKENRQLKAEKQQLAAEAEEARKNAIFWKDQATRLMKNHPTFQEVSVIFKATAGVPKKEPKKSRLFTMD